MINLPQNPPSSFWIFGNQLPFRSSFHDEIPKNSPILMVESMEKLASRPYHKQKLVLLLSAMRHHADQLKKEGRIVDYYTLGSVENFEQGLAEHVKKHEPKVIQALQPPEYYHLEGLKKIAKKHKTALDLKRNDMFLVNVEEFKKKYRDKKHILLEYHYRSMRKNLGLLMDDGGKPAGGQWNFDKKNRLGFDKEVKPGEFKKFKPDEITKGVIKQVNDLFPNNPGNTNGFGYATTRGQALNHLAEFADTRLDLFGPYEDMMATGQPQVYHSMVSPYINIGLLHPLDVLEAVIGKFEKGEARLQSVEAMVRQIIGWREFIYGVYWLKMPGYKGRNFLDCKESLPVFFWTGKTRCNCLRTVIKQVLDTGYAHHIQRLMVISNFCTLIGVNPREVYDWFMEMFVDAYDWVMAPNVYGMGTFADGGFISTKPYVSSGAYINRMSDYCKSCEYNVKEKRGNVACPFNYLYWYFLTKNKTKLENMGRLSLMYTQLKKKLDSEIGEIKELSEKFIQSLF